MDIYLVRHAQSEANVNHYVLRKKDNISIELTDIGKNQATETGEYFKKLLLNSNKKIKVWNSPYVRTRMTAKSIHDSLSSANIDFSKTESILISERQFGLLDDVEHYSLKYEHEYNHFKLYKARNNEFFVRPPLGESPFDMCLRLDSFLKNLERDTDIDTHIVVSHGAAVRGLILMHQNLPYEEFTCPNPFNASVRLIEDNIYKGQVFCPTNVTG